MIITEKVRDLLISCFQFFLMDRAYSYSCIWLFNIFTIVTIDMYFINCNKDTLFILFIYWWSFLIRQQCVFEVNKENGLVLTELWPGVSIQDVQVSTGCSFEVREIVVVIVSLPQNSRIKPWAWIVGGAVTLWSMYSTPDREVRVRALTGDTVLCSWARHFTYLVFDSKTCCCGCFRVA